MVDKNKLLENLKIVQDEISINKDYLTNLDTTIGDGDHGLNMYNGFNSFDLAEMSSLEISEIFKTIAMKLISTVGGASGPIYGTLFMQYAKQTNNVEAIDLNLYIKMNESAIEAIMSRGGAKFKDKTLLDVLIPFAEDLKNESLDIAKKNLESNLLKTSEYVANKGRASYLGERSIGHVDPGCASIVLILRSLI